MKISLSLLLLGFIVLAVAEQDFEENTQDDVDDQDENALSDEDLGDIEGTHF